MEKFFAIFSLNSTFGEVSLNRLDVNKPVKHLHKFLCIISSTNSTLKFMIHSLKQLVCIFHNHNTWQATCWIHDHNILFVWLVFTGETIIHLSSWRLVIFYWCGYLYSWLAIINWHFAYTLRCYKFLLLILLFLFHCNF